MPQGGQLLSDVHVGYSRKRDVDRSGPRKLPKSDKASKNLNMNFVRSLSTMTRNAEMIAAGKFVRSGKSLATPSLQQQAAKQLERDRKSSAKTTFDPDSRKHVKGQRGAVDLDELGDLVPQLRSQLDAIRQEKAACKRTAAAAVASLSGAADAQTSSTSGIALSGLKRRRPGDSGGAHTAALVRALAGALEGNVEVTDSAAQSSVLEGDQSEALVHPSDVSETGSQPKTQHGALDSRAMGSKLKADHRCGRRNQGKSDSLQPLFAPLETPSSGAVCAKGRTVKVPVPHSVIATTRAGVFAQLAATDDAGED